MATQPALTAQKAVVPSSPSHSFASTDLETETNNKPLDMPALRVLVIGPASSGKSKVADKIRADLGYSQPLESRRDGLAGLFIGFCHMFLINLCPPYFVALRGHYLFIYFVN